MNARRIDTSTPAYRLLADGLQFPEGPVALPDGSVVLVEMRRKTLTRVLAGGTVEIIAELGGGPNGAAMGPQGRIYVTNNGGPEWIVDSQGGAIPVSPPEGAGGGLIQVVDLQTGTVETLYDRYQGRPLSSPNDLVFDDHGGFWFTDFGRYRPGSADRGGVYYAHAEGGRLEPRIFPLEHPNGIGLSPDGKRLYVAETPTGRCWAFDLQAPGVPAAGRQALAVLDGQFFDSLAVDSAGHVCVATMPVGAVSDISPDGGQIDQYLLPDPLVTNVCFGGPGLRTAYATLSLHGRLVAFEWPRPGLPLKHLNRP